jgi:hypothetical protein
MLTIGTKKVEFEGMKEIISKAGNPFSLAVIVDRELVERLEFFPKKGFVAPEKGTIGLPVFEHGVINGRTSLSIVDFKKA